MSPCIRGSILCSKKVLSYSLSYSLLLFLSLLLSLTLSYSLFLSPAIMGNARHISEAAFAGGGIPFLFLPCDQDASVRISGEGKMKI